MTMNIAEGFRYALHSIFLVSIQVLILLIIFFISTVATEKIRFSLLGFFWNKKGFDVIKSVVFSFFYFSIVAAIINISFVLILQRLNISILSVTAIRMDIIFLVLFIAMLYLVDWAVNFLSKVPSAFINPQLNTSSVTTIEIGKTKDDKYILYFNGYKVRVFPTKEELVEFLRKVRDYLDSEMYKQVFEALNNL